MHVPVRSLAFALVGLVWLQPIALPAWGQESALRSGLATEPDNAAIARAESLAPLRTLQIAYHGEPIIEYAAEGYSLDQPTNIKSLAKTIISALVGIAIERGVFDSVDQPITELLASHRIPDGTDPRIREITIGNLLTMQAGLERTSGPYYGRWVASSDWIAYALSRPFVAEPGGRMLYSTGNTHLLSAALTDSSGQDTHTLAQAWLGNPLDITIPPWTRDPQGIYFGGNEMALSPRAILAFGELYRQGGTVDGERVISETWIEASWTPRTRSEHNDDLYGYGWFITELAGKTVHYGFGFAGQMLYIVPDLGLTAVVTSDPTPPSPGRYYLDQLEALVSETVMTALQAPD